jgi:hypothetical protein
MRLHAAAAASDGGARHAGRAQVLDDVTSGALIPAKLHDTTALSVLEQVAEGAEAEVGLVEGGLLALHGLLDHGAPQDLLVLALQGQHRVHQQAETLLQLAGHVGDHGQRLLLAADEVFIEDELVAVLDEQVRGGVLHTQADHVFVVLLELAHQRRKVGVARRDHEAVDVFLLEGHVHRVDDQPDVGRVLAADRLLRDLDQLDGRLVEAALVVRVAAPVGISPLDQQLALVEQALQHQVDIELWIVSIAHADGDVLEIDEEGEPLLVLVVHCQEVPPRGSFRHP